MGLYRVVELADPDTNSIIYVSREPIAAKGREALNKLIADARSGKSGQRFEAVRAMLLAGRRPTYKCVEDQLSKEEAAAVVDRLRTQHNVQPTSHRLIPRVRVHLKADPTSPYLDQSPVYYVYDLVGPDTGEIFYVGKGSSRQRPRVDDHISKSKRGKIGHRFAIIRKLLAKGLKPEERRIATGLTEAVALQKEIDRIAELGLDKLTNDTPGGQTTPTGDNHWTRCSPEKVLRDDKHPSRLHPESRPRGENHGRHTKPEATARGERHGMAKLTPMQIAEIRDAYSTAKAAGRQITGRDLAKQHGVTPQQVSRILRGESWGLPSMIEKHGNAKLTPEQIAAIPRMLASGLNQKQVAAEFKVSHSLVNHYANK